MSVLIDALQSVGLNDPAWLVLCAVLLAVAGAVARRQGLSARRQGARIGRLEQRAALERIRRLQIEDTIRQAGIRLPWWPADDDVDQVDDDVAEYEPYSGPGPWPQDGVPLPHSGPKTHRLPTQDFTRHALRKDTTR